MFGRFSGPLPGNYDLTTRGRWCASPQLHSHDSGKRTILKDDTVNKIHLRSRYRVHEVGSVIPDAFTIRPAGAYIFYT